MKLGIMQPYLFPYIGYFQLINAVDTFVIYDDVNFIKGGWINRNFILNQGQRMRVTLELQGASSNALINAVSIGGNRMKLLKTIQQSYSKAPHFETVYPLLEKILLFEENNLALYLDNSLRQVCAFLSITPKWLISSDLKKNNVLQGQDKVLSICKELGAEQYINVPGGKELYSYEHFEKESLKLSFIQPKLIEYKQFQNNFVPELSVIDVLMFNSKQETKFLLERYSLD